MFCIISPSIFNIPKTTIYQNFANVMTIPQNLTVLPQLPYNGSYKLASQSTFFYPLLNSLRRCLLLRWPQPSLEQGRKVSVSQAKLPCLTLALQNCKFQDCCLPLASDVSNDATISSYQPPPPPHSLTFQAKLLQNGKVLHREAVGRDPLWGLFSPHITPEAVPLSIKSANA